MSSLYQKRGIFYYQAKDEDGNRIQRSLRTRDREEAKRIHLLMKLACHTGMRLGEIAILKWKRGAEDFGTRHSRNYVYLDTEEKNLIVTFKRKLRGIPVEHIWGVLEKMLGRREPSDAYVFTSPATGAPTQFQGSAGSGRRR